jgi:hypothetical protein
MVGIMFIQLSSSHKMKEDNLVVYVVGLTTGSCIISLESLVFCPVLHGLCFCAALALLSFQKIARKPRSANFCPPQHFLGK